jgi:putative ABC transport system permease protein
MRPSGLFYFYRLRLRTRWVQELFALVGIAVGVALVFSAQVANTSLVGSVRQLVEGTSGDATLQLLARDPRGFDERVLDEARKLPGVAVAAPLLEARVNVLGPRGRRALLLIGADRSLAELGGEMTRRYRSVQVPSARFLALPGPVARDIGVPIGGRLTIELGARQRAVRLSTALETSDIGSLSRSPVAIVPLTFAQSLAGGDTGLARVLVRAEPGQEELVRRGLTGLAGDSFDVRPADFDVALFEQAAEPTNQSTALFATISALVGFLFAFNAMLLTLADRRRMVRALQYDGYSPWAVLEILVFDALALGLTASLVGLLLGDQLSRHLFDATPGYLSFAFAVGEQRIVEWQTVAFAALAGVGAALLASLLPMADLARGPAGTLAPRLRRLDLRRTALGAGCASLLGALAVLVLLPSAAVAGIALLVAALMLLLPAAIEAMLQLAARVLGRLRSAVPIISIGELRSMPARSIALAATGALAVFGIVAIQGARTDLQSGLDESAREVNAPADVWAAPGGVPNMLATTPFRGGQDRQLRRLPEVESVDRYYSSFLSFDQRRVWVFAQPSQPGPPFPPGQLTSGDRDVVNERLRTGGWAVISEAIAKDHRLSIGDRFTLPAPRPTSVRVAGLSTNIGWPPGAIAMSPNDYRAAWDEADPSAYEVQLAPGVSPARGRTAVASILGPNSALAVETAAQREDRQRAASRQGLARLNQLAILVLVAAVLAMAAATAGMVWQRRGRLASLKLDGFDDLTVWRALLLESVLLLGAGCLVGAAFGLLGEALLDRALKDVTGFPVQASIGLPIAAMSFVAVTAIAVLIAALPGYLAARVHPSAALQE